MILVMTDGNVVANDSLPKPETRCFNQEKHLLFQARLLLVQRVTAIHLQFIYWRGLMAIKTLYYGLKCCLFCCLSILRQL